MRTGFSTVLAATALTAGILAAANAPAAAGPGAGHTFTRLFDTPYAQNQQGLAWADGYHYVGFDMGGGQSRVVVYDDTGKEIRRSGLLPLGHAAELSFRQADGNLYVATGGGSNPTYVNVVDMRPATPVVRRTYDFTALGNNGMVAVDNANDRMVVFAGPTGGPYTVAFADFSGTVSSRFTLPDLGTPQGIEVVDGTVLYYTSAEGFTHNTVTVLGTSGAVLDTIDVPIANEGEGLAVDPTTNRVYLGFHSPRTVYAMSPVAALPYGVNTLLNPGAESGVAGPGHPTTVAVPGWGVTGGMSTIGYAVGGGYPTAGSPGPARRGAAFFTGGTAGTATLTRTVDTAVLAGDIDANGVAFTLSGHLGGYLAQADDARLAVTFRNGTGASLGTAQIGPVTPADRGNTTGLLPRTSTGAVPAGTRSMTVVLTATRGAGTNNDGYADNLSLVLSHR